MTSFTFWKTVRYCEHEEYVYVQDNLYDMNIDKFQPFGAVMKL